MAYVTQLLSNVQSQLAEEINKIKEKVGDAFGLDDLHDQIVDVAANLQLDRDIAQHNLVEKIEEYLANYYTKEQVDDKVANNQVEESADHYVFTELKFTVGLNMYNENTNHCSGFCYSNNGYGTERMGLQWDKIYYNTTNNGVTETVSQDLGWVDHTYGRGLYDLDLTYTPDRPEGQYHFVIVGRCGARVLMFGQFIGCRLRCALNQNLEDFDVRKIQYPLEYTVQSSVEDTDE